MGVTAGIFCFTARHLCCWLYFAQNLEGSVMYETYARV